MNDCPCNVDGCSECGRESELNRNSTVVSSVSLESYGATELPFLRGINGVTSGSLQSHGITAECNICESVDCESRWEHDNTCRGCGTIGCCNPDGACTT